MPAQLVAVTEGPNILLDKPIVLVGRHQECDIQIPSRKISRRHCCIAQVDDHLVVRDLCSTNGIRINGVRVHEGLLRPGDELTIGNFRYQVNWGTNPGAPMIPPPAVAVPVKPREYAALVAAQERDGLESCEEPIPLAEPEEGNHQGVPAALPVGGAPVGGIPNGPPPAQDPDKKQPPLVPEDLKLAPVSDPPLPPAN